MNKELRNHTLASLVAGALVLGTCTLTSKPTTVLPNTAAQLTPFVIPTYFSPNPVRYRLDGYEDRTVVYVGNDFLLSHRRYIDEGNDGTLDEVANWLPIRATAGYYDAPISQLDRELYKRIVAHSSQR